MSKFAKNGLGWRSDDARAGGKFWRFVLGWWDIAEQFGGNGGLFGGKRYAVGGLLGQPETFAKSKTQQEIVNAPSFPRRRESWLNLHNDLFLLRFLNIKQDSRLRGNDGIFCVSGCC